MPLTAHELDSLMDEMEDAMTTQAWLSTTAESQAGDVRLYRYCLERQMEQQILEISVAMAIQQVAAKAMAEATEAALRAIEYGEA